MPPSDTDRQSGPASAFRLLHCLLLEEHPLADQSLASKVAEAKGRLQTVLVSMPEKGASLLKFVPNDK